jgi:cellulose biosynthesis protein BcsQ
VLVCLGAGQPGAEFAHAWGDHFEAVVEVETVDECVNALLPRFAGRMAKEFSVVTGDGDDSVVAVAVDLARRGASVVCITDQPGPGDLLASLGPEAQLDPPFAGADDTSHSNLRLVPPSSHPDDIARIWDLSQVDEQEHETPTWSSGWDSVWGSPDRIADPGSPASTPIRDPSIETEDLPDPFQASPWPVSETEDGRSSIELPEVIDPIAVDEEEQPDPLWSSSWESGDDPIDDLPASIEAPAETPDAVDPFQASPWPVSETEDGRSSIELPEVIDPIAVDEEEQPDPLWSNSWESGDDPIDDLIETPDAVEPAIPDPFQATPWPVSETEDDHSPVGVEPIDQPEVVTPDDYLSPESEEMLLPVEPPIHLEEVETVGGNVWSPEPEQPAVPEPDMAAETEPSPFAMEEEVVAVEPLLNPAAVDPLMFQTRSERGIGGPRRGEMIVVAGPKGGIGKTTFSLLLAETLGQHLAATGRKVCYLDANVGQADGGAYLEKYIPKVGLRTIVSLAKNPELPSIGLITTKMEGLHFDGLLGPRSNIDVASGLITPNLYALATDSLLAEYDYVIVDTQVAEYGNNMFGFFLLPHLDHLICLVPPIPQAVDRSALWLQSISDTRYSNNSSIPMEKISILLNGFNPKASYGPLDAEKPLSAWNIVGVIPHVEAIAKATLDRDLMSALPSVLPKLRDVLGEMLNEPGLMPKGRSEASQRSPAAGQASTKKRLAILRGRA